MVPALYGESHSLVVHKLWELVVVGSNPSSPTTFRNTSQASQEARKHP